MPPDKISRAGESANPLLRCQINPPPRILVVDDDISIRQLTAEVLFHAGYVVATAADGTVAWHALTAESYDLVIADNDMPGSSGLSLARKLRSARMTLPIIMTTRALPREEFARYSWLQPAATLLKPYGVEEMLRTVKEILRATEEVRSPIPPSPDWQRQSSADGLAVR